MLLNSDIHPDWPPADIALFAALVERVQSMIGQTVREHHRKQSDDAVQDLIMKALLVAFKSEHVFQGLRRNDLGEVFVECEARLRAEIVDMSRAKRDFMASLNVEGRA